MPEGLEVKRISVKYPGVTSRALSRLSFTLRRGSFLVVSGASGSGKTTLLRALAGLTDLSEGNIYWQGARVAGPAEKLVPGYSHIKLVTQELDLQEKMTVSENLRHALRAFAEPYRSSRVKELVSLCRLKGLEERLPFQLSGGQRQRVVWAINLADEPELLLLDEPFSHLDVLLKAEMTALLKEIREVFKVTTIMVTHDPAEALSLGDRILLLKKGGMEMLDTPAKVYERPSSEHAAAFFGEANFFSPAQLRELGIAKRTRAGKAWMLRPEHITLAADGEGIRCRVEDSQFRGFYHVLLLKTSTGVSLKMINDAGLERGADCSVTLNVSGLHLLPA